MARYECIVRFANPTKIANLSKIMKISRHFSYPKISDNSMLSKNKNSSMVRMCCEFRKAQRAADGMMAELPELV
jgi:hypothetical protein